MLKQRISIGVFVVYIDTGSLVPNIPLKSHDLADENNKILTEWKGFETTVLSHCPMGHFHFDGSSGHIGINGYQVCCL